MKPVHCRIKHDPPHSYGDCWRACIASLLEISRPEDIPHFAEDGCDFETSVARIREYLFPNNAFLTHFAGSIPLNDVLSFMGQRNPNIYYLLCAEGHVVVCKDDKIVHDPAWFKTALVPPSEQWVVLVITEASM
jgi:hypothetical protein